MKEDGEMPTTTDNLTAVALKQGQTDGVRNAREMARDGYGADNWPEIDYTHRQCADALLVATGDDFDALGIEARIEMMNAYIDGYRTSYNETWVIYG